MWKVAGFLYWAGEEWPWIWLQNASQSHGQPLDPTTLVDTMVDLMIRRGATPCAWTIFNRSRRIGWPRRSEGG